ncbi:MAG: hypothetical protein C0599_13255, partial [Salinivirgaceae bacterium]
MAITKILLFLKLWEQEEAPIQMKCLTKILFMKRLIIIATLICVGILNLSAQETQIDLSKYKLPDMKRQTLEFNFDLN